MYSRMFLTGCDVNTEWMLKWFRKTFHSDYPIAFADFGVSPEMREWVNENFDVVIEVEPHKDKAWFCKPKAMLEAASLSYKTVWIDTDCEMLKPIDNIFNYVTPNKLSMVQDIPWTTRRGEIWHNTGVVGVCGKPKILIDWIKAIDKNPIVGDQEVLHALLRKDALTRRVYVEDIPEIYNWLRLNDVDSRENLAKRIMHWTGKKGKEVIRKKVDLSDA